MQIVKKCEVCDRDFEPKKLTAKYCSIACRRVTMNPAFAAHLEQKRCNVSGVNKYLKMPLIGDQK